MKYAKIITLAAMALTAFMAMAGTASATTLTSPTGTTYTGTLKATSTNYTMTSAFGGFGSISCGHSLLEGNITTHGSGVTVTGHITKLTLTLCTGGTPTSPVVQPGTLEFHSSGGNAATLTSLNELVDWHGTPFGTCGFGTSSTGTSIGTLKGSTNDTSRAVIEINGKLEGKSGFCGSATWHGKYEVTSPVPLFVD